MLGGGLQTLHSLLGNGEEGSEGAEQGRAGRGYEEVGHQSPAIHCEDQPGTNRMQG